MKTLAKYIAALVGALTLTVAASAATLVLNVNVFNGASNYDDVVNLNLSVGSYCSYYEYLTNGGRAEVRVTGGGVNIDDNIYSGSSSGGAVFTSRSPVTGSVYASAGQPGQGVAHLEFVW